MLVAVMGVSGSGKSTVGVLLAERLGAPFVDGDDLHPPTNLALMAGGTALTDLDRAPWLDAIGHWLRRHDPDGVVACSALRRSYRDLLRQHCPALVFLQLDGSAEVIAARMRGREHFMPVELLDSQLAALESLAPDENGLVVGLDLPPGEIVDRFLAWARGSGPPASS